MADEEPRPEESRGRRDDGLRLKGDEMLNMKQETPEQEAARLMASEQSVPEYDWRKHRRVLLRHNSELVERVRRLESEASAKRIDDAARLRVITDRVRMICKPGVAEVILGFNANHCDCDTRIGEGCRECCDAEDDGGLYRRTDTGLQCSVCGWYGCHGGQGCTPEADR